MPGAPRAIPTRSSRRASSAWCRPATNSGAHRLAGRLGGRYAGGAFSCLACVLATTAVRHKVGRDQQRREPASLPTRVENGPHNHEGSRPHPGSDQVSWCSGQRSPRRKKRTKGRARHWPRPPVGPPPAINPPAHSEAVCIQWKSVWPRDILTPPSGWGVGRVLLIGQRGKGPHCQIASKG